MLEDIRQLKLFGALAAIEASHFSLRFTEFGAFLKVMALVAVTFSFTKAQLHLHAATFKVEAGADNGEAFLLCRHRQLKDLALVEEKLAGTLRGMLKPLTSGLPRLNITAIKERLIAFNTREGIANVHLPLADRFHLSAYENKPCFEGALDVIIVARTLIGDGILSHRGGAEFLLEKQSVFEVY